MGRHVETEPIGVGVGLGQAQFPTADIHPGVGVVHREIPGLQPEFLDVGHRQAMRAGDAHGAGFGIQAVRERLPQRVDAPAHARARLQQHRPMPGALQLVGGHQPGHARPHDHHLSRVAGGRQPFLDERERIEPGHSPSR